jgi:DNA-binding beta-propeller fold protein YncE
MSRRLVLALLAAALLAPACERAARPPDAARETGAEPRVWPAPPARPRIRWVAAVAGPEDLGIRPSLWARAVRLVAGAATSGLVRPTGVAARDGVLYVADPGTPALWVLDAPGGRVARVTEAGGRPLASPVAVALGTGPLAGRVLVADSARAVVSVHAADGQPLAVIADPRFRRPAGLVYDAARDRLYVADSAAHRIWVLDGGGRPAGAHGTRGARPGEFNFPTHLALAPDGTLLVTDALGYRLQTLDPDGAPRGHFGRHGDTAGDFASPKGVALDSAGHVYVVEALFDAVQIFDRRGRFLLAFGERGTGRGQLWLPGGLFIDARDRIYVADAYNRRVQVFEYLGGTPGGSEEDAGG